jgi:hypothetical protein
MLERIRIVWILILQRWFDNVPNRTVDSERRPYRAGVLALTDVDAMIRSPS